MFVLNVIPYFFSLIYCSFFHRLADLGAKTYGEEQTAMHYAAKNNAAASIKVMLRLGALINDRDYKRRTPLFVAAETGKHNSCFFIQIQS